jgi:hypothetical protein
LHASARSLRSIKFFFAQLQTHQNLNLLFVHVSIVRPSSAAMSQHIFFRKFQPVPILISFTDGGNLVARETVFFYFENPNSNSFKFSRRNLEKFSDWIWLSATYNIPVLSRTFITSVHSTIVNWNDCHVWFWDMPSFFIKNIHFIDKHTA